MTIDILCKVVDNYGDIGVAYRLAKALSDLDPSLSIRLHVDDLASFRSLCPEVDPALDEQSVRGWTVLSWRSGWLGLADPRPRVVLECFACGRPERFEELLFDQADPEPRYVLNIEHLTAEPWAEDFHLLPSATRSALVKKWMFMPGFTAGTGGLIIDRRFREARDAWLDPALRVGRRAALAAELLGRGATSALKADSPGSPDRGGGAELAGLAEHRWVSVFSYERDFGRVVADLTAAQAERPLLALAAAGRSQACFLAAWKEAGRPFPVFALPFLPQETWDEVLLASDFSIVRGEESLARAALAGRPFLWHAYLQEGRHQLVKVRALLDRLRPYFRGGAAGSARAGYGITAFAAVEEAFLAFNDRERDDPAVSGSERIAALLSEEAALPFRAFSDDLMALGDLAGHLVTYLREIV